MFDCQHCAVTRRSVTIQLYRLHTGCLPLPRPQPSLHCYLAYLSPPLQLLHSVVTRPCSQSTTAAAYLLSHFTAIDHANMTHATASNALKSINRKIHFILTNIRIMETYIVLIIAYIIYLFILYRQIAKMLT